MVCRLRHKIDRGRIAQDTRRDLVACFAWKQIMLWFLSLTLRLTEVKLRVVHVESSWRLRREEAEYRRVDTTDYVGPFYPEITVSSVLGPRGIVDF
jgi:hypothetical protein